MFKALLLENQDGKTVPTLTRLAESQLPEGEVRVAVAYSSINYKDGLAITGKGKIVRQWPLVPGIDFAGTVLESADSRYQPGDKVVLTGWGVGEGHWGGMAEQARVKGTGWCRCPPGWMSGRPCASVPPVSPPCSACWHWKRRVLLPQAARCWSLVQQAVWAPPRLPCWQPVAIRWRR